MGCKKHVLTILVPQTGWFPAINRSLLSHYGLISMDNICEHALTYVSTDGSQSAQDNMMCYTCITMSLSKVGRKKNTSQLLSYHVNEEYTYWSAVMTLRIMPLLTTE